MSFDAKEYTYLCCTSALGRAACIQYLGNCSADVTNVAPAHRGDAAGAGGVVQGKINNNNGISGDR